MSKPNIRQPLSSYTTPLLYGNYYSIMHNQTIHQPQVDTENFFLGLLMFFISAICRDLLMQQYIILVEFLNLSIKLLCPVKKFTTWNSEFQILLNFWDYMCNLIECFSFFECYNIMLNVPLVNTFCPIQTKVAWS